MTAVSQAGAVSRNEVDWHAINWQQAHTLVRRLQARIVRATQAGRWGKVRALQRLLTHSFSAKVLAVKLVTENQGKRTPGVDGVIWDTPEKKAMSDRAENRVLLHPNCHTQVHSQGLPWLNRVLVRALARLERHTGKLVRAVLRELGESNPARLPGGDAQRCRVESCDTPEAARREQQGIQSRPNHWRSAPYSTGNPRMPLRGSSLASSCLGSRPIPFQTIMWRQ
jgi:N-terminal domain of reverse transcriptase